MTTFKPSKQQKAYFNWITKGNGSCVLEAVAGSGKTTTLIEGLKLMSGDIFFGAYNKKIADEIKGKVSLANVSVATMHSAGLSAWKTVAKYVKVDSNKCRDIFREMFKDDENAMEVMGAVLSLVSYAKQAAFHAVVANPTSSDWMELVDHFNVDCLERDEYVVDLAMKVLSESIRRDYKVIDFDDMILAPLVHKVKAREYDWVLIDEAQDTNASRRALALLMLRRGGRLVAVGDRHQAIYGFTGADSDALDLIANAVSAKQISLTVSYRCPQAVVAEAQKYVEHIEAHPKAVEGVVSSLESFESILDHAKIGDAILCRFNAPVVNLAYSFIAKGIPAQVEGRDLGNNLKALARRWKAKSFSVLQERLEGYLHRETAKYRMKEKESMAASVEDRVRCLNVIINRVMDMDPKCKTPIDKICEEIDKIFGDNISTYDRILLSTIHKSKGREFDKVFWIQGTSKYARKEWEKQAERNLKYVAATRAKQELVLVPEPEKDEK